MRLIRCGWVEYHSIFTSNHNTGIGSMSWRKLNIIPFLHQTTTPTGSQVEATELNIIPFLHQTTTSTENNLIITTLNIIPFLHQTTTASDACCCFLSWISFHFYIKPQPEIYNYLPSNGWISFHFYIKPQPPGM